MKSGTDPPLRSAVLGDAVRDGLVLWVSCVACKHRARLAPARLAARLGYDLPVPDVARRMRCSRCRGRAVEVRLETPGQGPVTRHT